MKFCLLVILCGDCTPCCMKVNILIQREFLLMTIASSIKINPFKYKIVTRCNFMK